MGNSPRYIGFIDPPYNVELVDDDGKAIDLTGCNSNSFTLTMLNEYANTSKVCTGVWTITDAAKGKASYQYMLSDVDTAGRWKHYVTAKLPSEPGPREFDPDPVDILPGTVGAGVAPAGVLPAPAASPLVINVRDYGALGDGTDQTTAIANARAAANNIGAALVYYPPGLYLTGNQPCYSNVIDDGAGPGLTIVRLKNGANTDIFSALTSSINLAAAPQSGSNTAITNFGFRNMTLDGNKANQTAGPSYAIRVYGHRHVLEHVEIKNGYSGNVLMDYNGSANPSAPNNAFMPRWYDVMSHDCNGFAYEIGGPTDMQWIAVNGFASGSHVAHIGPNCVALRMAHCHLWATPIGNNSVTLLNEAAELVLSSCQIEGSDTCALVNLANDFQSSCLELGSTADASRQGRGLQLGQQAGQTPYAGQVYQSGGLTTAATANVCHISGKIYDCNAGAIDERNTSGNIYDLNVYQTGGTAIVGGYLNPFSAGMITVEGLVLDGSPGTGGTFQMANMRSYNGFKAFGQTGDAIFAMNTMSKANGGGFALQNGYAFGLFTDGGNTYANDFANNAAGQIWFGNGFDTYVQKSAAGIVQVGNAAKLGSGPTLFSGSGVPSSGMGSNGDFYFRTDTPGTVNQRIYVKSSGAWVGIV